MRITLYKTVAWDNEVCLRDEPSGHQTVALRPLQLEILWAEDFPTGKPVPLPQPDASYSCVTVIRHGENWHFLQPDGRELIIDDATFAAARATITALYTETNDAHLD